jgi:hypothetical protein
MGIFGDDKKETHELKRIADALWELVYLERRETRNHIVDFTLTQLRGDTFMAINGTVVGTTSTFQISFVPATNFIPLPSPPTVTVDDTNVTLGAVDPVTLQFTATVASTDTGASYNLTVAGTNDKRAALSHVFNVPILPTPPPPPTSVSDFDLSQLS